MERVQFTLAGIVLALAASMIIFPVRARAQAPHLSIPQSLYPSLTPNLSPSPSFNPGPNHHPNPPPTTGRRAASVP